MSTLQKTGFRYPKSWFWPMAILAIVLVVFLGDTTSVYACPNCKDTLAHHGGRMQYGYALSIFLMIAAPFTILAAWTVAIYRMLKANHQAN